MKQIFENNKENVCLTHEKQDFVNGKHAKLSHEPAQADLQKQGAIVLRGAAANSLDVADERVPACIQSLVTALKTPSEKVQRAVSLCLPALVKVRVKHLSKHLFS